MKKSHVPKASPPSSLEKSEKLICSWYVFTAGGDIMYTRTGDYFGKQNFITTGHINRVILTIATPLMINNLIRTLYNLTDGYMWRNFQQKTLRQPRLFGR